MNLLPMILSATVAATAAQAETIDRHQVGSWIVELENDAAMFPNQYSCTANLPTRQGDLLAIGISENGDVGLMMYMTQVLVAEGIGDVFFTIWKLSGPANYHISEGTWFDFSDRHDTRLSAVTYFVLDHNDAVAASILSDIRAGSEIRLSTEARERGDVVAGFNLRGSRAALDEVAACVRSIQGKGA